MKTVELFLKELNYRTKVPASTDCRNCFRDLMLDIVANQLELSLTHAHEWCKKNNPILEVKTAKGIEVYTFKGGYKGLQELWC